MEHTLPALLAMNLPILVLILIGLIGWWLNDRDADREAMHPQGHRPSRAHYQTTSRLLRQPARCLLVT